MKKLAALVITALLALTSACGDNLGVEDGERRDGEVWVIPQADKVLLALESAEDVGFTDAVYLADADIIAAFGPMDLADEARMMPGIVDVIPAEGAIPLLPDPDLSTRAPARDDLGDLAITQGPDALDQARTRPDLSDLAVYDAFELAE